MRAQHDTVLVSWGCARGLTVRDRYQDLDSVIYYMLAVCFSM